jgi:hypothetical protein
MDNLSACGIKNAFYVGYEQNCPIVILKNITLDCGNSEKPTDYALGISTGSSMPILISDKCIIHRIDQVEGATTGGIHFSMLNTNNSSTVSYIGLERMYEDHLDFVLLDNNSDIVTLSTIKSNGWFLRFEVAIVTANKWPERSDELAEILRANI